MKKTILSSFYKKVRNTKTKFRRGLVLPMVIGLIMGLIGVLGILGFAIEGAPEYNEIHRIAQDIAEDPNSHTEEEINGATDRFLDMATDVVRAGTVGPGGATGGGIGINVALYHIDKLREARIAADATNPSTVCMDIKPLFCQTTGVAGQMFIWDLDLDENGEYEDAVNCQYYSSTQLTAEIPILNNDATMVHGDALFIEPQSGALSLYQYKYGLRDGKWIDCNGEGELESCTIWSNDVEIGTCE